MNDRIRNKILVAAVVAVIAGLFLPAILGGKEDPWGRFIYDYQTLISGIAAVFAAVLTIRQMQRSDRAALAQHREAIDLQTLPDARRVKKLYNAVGTKLSEIAKSSIFSEALPVVTTTNPDKDIFDVSSWLAQVHIEVRIAWQCLDHEAWEEAREAIPAELQADRLEAKAIVQKLHSMKEYLVETIKNTGDFGPFVAKGYLDHMLPVGKAYLRAFDQLSEDLERIKGK